MHQLAKEMPRFLERHPEVLVDLVIEDRRVDIVKENIDISVRPWPPETTSLVVRKIFDFERLLCASPAYLKRHGTPRSPEDLARHRCMGVSSIPNHGQWMFRMPGGPRAIEVPLSASINNADLVFRFALAGQGIARLNEFIVAEAIADGRLVQVLADFQCAEHLTMLAIYPQERHRLPRVAAMLDFLVETFAKKPWHTLRTRPPKRARESR
jgi:DNA-binding transcriptional LysR family regulator